MSRRNSSIDKRLRSELTPVKVVCIVTLVSHPAPNMVHVTFQRLNATGRCVSMEDEFLTTPEAKSLCDQLSSAIGRSESIPADW